VSEKKKRDGKLELVKKTIKIYDRDAATYPTNEKKLAKIIRMNFKRKQCNPQ